MTTAGAEPAALPRQAALPAVRTGIGARLRPWVALTKPRIIELLLVTTVPAMVLAAGGWPGLALVVVTLIGGTLTAGASNALNMVLERDLDALMTRTRDRPLPSGAVTPVQAVVFAIALAAVGTAVLWVGATPLAALLALSALVFYVGVYTAILKRRTPQNIVIGGAAGAVPALVGWAAVTGDLSAAAWILFAVVVLWTPPHFWALAILHEDEYRTAGFPMMPVVRGIAVTTRQSLWYAVATVVASLALFLTATPVGWVYGTVAVVAGGDFIRRSVLLHRDPSRPRAGALFGGSIVYLAVLSAGLVADRLLLG
jgi:heme o synthase